MGCPGWRSWLLAAVLMASLAGLDAPAPADPIAALPAAADVLAPDEGRLVACVRAQREGPQLEAAREELERRIAGEMRDPPHIEITRHRQLLLAAANAGSWSAAARLVDLGWWNALRQIDSTRPVVAAWKDDGRAIGPLRVGQVYAQLWLAHRVLTVELQKSDSGHVRKRWLEMVQRWPVVHPMLLATAMRSWADFRPVQPDLAAGCFDRALQAFAADPLYAGDDLLAMQGRADALLRCAGGMQGGDAELAGAVFAGAAARCAERGLWAGEGINLLAAARITSGGAAGGSGDGSDGRLAALGDIEALFARAGDIARQAHCHALITEARWRGKPGMLANEAAAIDAAYHEAAELCRRAGDWDAFADIMLKEVSFLVAAAAPDPAPRYRAAALCAAAAAHAHALTDNPLQQGRCLHLQATLQSAMLHVDSDWHEVVRLRRMAEDCFARDDEPAADPAGPAAPLISKARLQNLCEWAEVLAGNAQHAEAHALFLRLAAMLHGLDGDEVADLRRRLDQGLRCAAR